MKKSCKWTPQRRALGVVLPLAGTALLTTAWSGSAASTLDDSSLIPTIIASVDGKNFMFESRAVEKPGGIVFEIPETVIGSENDGFQIKLGGTLNPDPSLAFGIAVIDFGAPSAFGFMFMTPIVPVPGANTVTGSIVGGLTDFTGDGVSITPILADADGDAVAEIMVNSVLLPPTNMGVDVGAAAAFGAGTPGAFYAYGAFSAGPMPGPVGGWTGLSSTLGFSLSGGGDIAALTGFTSIVPVPEVNGGMAVGALALLGALVRRLRK